MILLASDQSLSNLFLSKSSLLVFMILCFPFLAKIDFIEPEFQQGLSPKISRVLQHTSMMASIIDKAGMKQWSIVITLIDLKNAFGEVHHNLIKEALNHQHALLAI